MESRVQKLISRSVRLVAQVVAPAVIVACSTSTAMREHVVKPRVDGSRSDPPRRHNVILPDKIKAIGAQTAYEAVAQLHLGYLASGRAPVAPVAVIQCGLPESLDALRAIPADQIAKIRFVEPHDAVTEFGAQYSGGVVVVRLTGFPVCRGAS
jgi:hypothetical protein